MVVDLDPAVIVAEEEAAEVVVVEAVVDLAARAKRKNGNP